ncbi:hypothetical protein [Phaffia rhodozyma]|uniref:Uncharacterized protein n=1 Tax=Phaffia rhodozyma TaxID=264483 RepID=A0A0F7SJC3_PHARH|nr:hypothetical protein [Phaffia rhodozyma]
MLSVSSNAPSKQLAIPPLQRRSKQKRQTAQPLDSFFSWKRPRNISPPSIDQPLAKAARSSRRLTKSPASEARTRLSAFLQLAQPIEIDSAPPIVLERVASALSELVWLLEDEAKRFRTHFPLAPNASPIAVPKSAGLPAKFRHFIDQARYLDSTTPLATYASELEHLAADGSGLMWALMGKVLGARLSIQVDHSVSTSQAATSVREAPMRLSRRSTRSTSGSSTRSSHRLSLTYLIDALLDDLASGKL